MGALIIMDSSNAIAGIATERDLLYKCHESGHDPKKTRITEIMTPAERIIIGTLEDSTTYLMKVMTEKKIRHVPIIDNEKLVGVISVRDVIRTTLEESETEARMLRDFVRNPYGIPPL